MTIAEARTKLNALTDPRIKDVGNLFLDLGIELVGCGKETEIRKRKQIIGHVDLLFKDQEVRRIFFLEVSTQEDDRARKISHFFSRWENQENIETLRKRFKLPSTYKNMRLYFDLSKKCSCPESVAALFSKTNNHFLNEYDFNYFVDAHAKVGRWARNDFFRYLEIKPLDQTKKTKDAIQFFLGDNIRAYTFVDTAKNLLQYCYVFRRKKEDSGYQRILEKGRIGEIAKKIESGNILAFPNSVLISCPDSPQLCASPKDKSDCPAHVKILIPNYFSACRIIDGQHRLLSFARLDEGQQETHFIPIVAFENIELHDEMRTFIEINSGQKKMDRNLILLLQADFKWDRKVSVKEYYEKQAVIVVKKLNNEPPLKGKIFIPEVLAKKEAKITLTTLVSAIIGNNFIGKRMHLYQKKHNDTITPYKKIKKIFVLLIQKMPQYCQDADSFFLTNKGSRVIFRLIQIYERNHLKRNIDFSLTRFFDDLARIFNDKLVESLNDFYGEGGANRAVQEVFQILKKKDKRKRYAKITFDLRHLR